MVEFVVSDNKADGFAITEAFRQASDDDVRNVMNAMSNPTDVDSLKFYIVPSSWFAKAWRLFNARSEDEIDEDWRDNIGSIPNSELLNIEHEVTSDEEDPADDQQKMKRFEKLHLRMPKNRQDGTMKNGLEHTKDYFFLGASAWLLVKEKFGYDGYELERACVTNTGRNSLDIKLKLEESNGATPTLITIPGSGRFAYEKVMNNKASTVAIISEGNSGDNADIMSRLTQGVIIPFNSNDASANDSSNHDMDTDSQPMAGRKRHASGLGNLGNTCFMNSTLQCLAHTEPLLQYFLSGEYQGDLNKDNPLGTGGELASEFANLIREMWGIPVKRHGVVSASTLSAVYPRQFKQCVGRHAEQFMGYDQHDSQEFATYLLDALHEDTNRVTKKPYIEKPEQGKDEPDDIAANKAWELHLKREDSRVLENFMGQVKSRLECCEATCDRVSTTFDPFMYLSVPIPGESDRQLNVTFVPLKPDEKPRSFDLTVPKTALMGKVFSLLNDKLIEIGIRSDPIPLHDLVAVDVWSHEIFNWYELDSDVDRIRPTDKTFIFELNPQHQITEESKKRSAKPDELESSLSQVGERGRVQLDVETLTRLNKSDNWQKELEKYVQTPHTLYVLFNEKRGTIEERLQFYNKLRTFLDQCQKEVEDNESSPKAAAAENDEEMKDESGDNDNGDNHGDKPYADAVEIQGLVDRSDASSTFANVKTKQDVEILGFCANKIRQLVLKLIEDKKNKYQDGVTIQVSMRKHKNAYSATTKLAAPIALRIPSTMTVYGLRQELAKRLSRSLQSDLKERASSSAESTETSQEKTGPMNGDHSFGSPELSIIRQIPFTFDRKDGNSYGGTRSTYNSKQLGMLEKTHTGEGVLADPNDEAEKDYVADVLGPLGNVTLEWPADLCERCFDEAEYDSVEVNESNEKKDEKAVTTVSDCIEKYCQMEQLEETEMWYCNQCQKHVRAWKQFHIYRAPPILIIHLKRFHYSARTHRRDKITSFIDFPLKGLDLTKMVSSYTEEGKPIYDCYAVSNHYGGLGGGHYTAHILDDDGKWYYYDDSRMSEAEEKDVLTEAAYVLYYRRQDVPVGQEFAIPTPEPVPSLAPAPAAIESEPANQMDNDESDLSSNVSTFGVVADDDDGMAVDGDSKAESSPVEPMDAEVEIAGYPKEDFPPLQ